MKKSWENNGKDHGKIMEIFLDVTRHGDEKKSGDHGEIMEYSGTYSLRRIYECLMVFFMCLNRGYFFGVVKIKLNGYIN